MRRLRVGGVALCSSGYPNAKETIRLLQQDDGWIVRDKASWLPPKTRLWQLAKGPWYRRVWSIVRLGLTGFVQACSIATTTQGDEKVYLPYPAPLTLWWLSFIPVRWRPHCIADAYISLWDSMFRDRGAGNVNSVPSKLLKRFERRSLHAARLILVDTEANRQQFIEDFGLDSRKVRSVPLAIDAAPFLKLRPTARSASGCIRVLFVGTLVPLHGTETILAAMTQLANEPGIEFRLVGDGQQGKLIEGFVARLNPSNFTWIREWQSLEAIASEIERADICLGVFGGDGKASHVLPFKLYYALAAGRAIITQAKYSLPEGVSAPPMALSTGVSSQERGERLALEIRDLAKDQKRRSALAEAAKSYFLISLSGAAVLKTWNRLFNDN